MLYLEEESLSLHGFNSHEQEKHLEAESMVLGAVFLESHTIHEIMLAPCHFSIKKNQLLFEAMLQLREKSRPIDPVTMLEQLGREIENIGGISYITEFAGACPTAAHVEHYQQIVLEHYKIRELKRSAATFLNSASMEGAESFYQTYIEMQEVGMRKEGSKHDVLMEIYDEIYEEHGDLSGVDTGFNVLNRMTGGWNSGDLIILAARPSMGKTALALNLAMNCCQKGGVVDLFSLEMPQKQLVKRILSSLTGIDGGKWRNAYKYFNEEDQVKANTAMGVYHRWKLQIHDQSGQTVADIRARIQKTRRDFPGENYLVVIDYLQLIAVTGKHERHDLAIASITKELKQIARQYLVPIILLSQLSRSVEQRMDKRPRMSDLRDSGSIEQDADVIILLYRDEYYNTEDKQNKIIEIDIAKQRNGPVGSVKFLFEKEVGRFMENITDEILS
ncbi:replicative DNA helicase [Bacillus sp. T33-2]|uniref:replicative DNA helicase n=1 Tax=Bacillus sp. T33-2 TaxID=2054168 RepID=UPI000C76A479|nr:replicative DNA helicase [Bacillus sp. T33-2]PLR92052.1 replicative DNA helicase [Bacillus sp. T33-2]